MNASLNFLLQLSSLSQQTFQRQMVLLKGSDEWILALLNQFKQQGALSHWTVLGELNIQDVECVKPKQGARLLGQENDCLVFDARDDFDANSFNASLGTLLGGGVVFLILPQHANTQVEHWFESQLNDFPMLSEGSFLPALPILSKTSGNADFEEQTQAIELIKKVVTGHRKRPLVLTADRGRGKTSALGLACASLLLERRMSICVTASTINAIEPLFIHAQAKLPSSERASKSELIFEQSSIRFIASDELLQTLPECDLLIVDEAAAIPIPMLKSMTEHYHRLVFSTTVHGYEGSGRGFTLKFTQWLSSVRSGMKAFHIHQPIRWGLEDNLERWANQVFLLKSELQDNPNFEHLSDLAFRQLSSEAFYSNPSLLEQFFSLLVNAHYQTSPNDLWQILSDPQIECFGCFSGDSLIGVISTVKEGGIDSALLTDITLGKRRPKGQLGASLLVGQLGFSDAGAQYSKRVMRIAVHPQLSRRGVGEWMLAQLMNASREQGVDFISTSFGATEELVAFWQSSGFHPVRLGTSRDAASGTHSLLMTRNLSAVSCEWGQQAQAMYKEFFVNSLPSLYPSLEPCLIRVLLAGTWSSLLNSTKRALLKSYSEGGASYESIEPWLKQLLLTVGVNQVSGLMIEKVLKHSDWKRCADLVKVAGRKQVESVLRAEIKTLLSSFTV